MESVATRRIVASFVVVCAIRRIMLPSCLHVGAAGHAINVACEVVVDYDPVISPSVSTVTKALNGGVRLLITAEEKVVPWGRGTPLEDVVGRRPVHIEVRHPVPIARAGVMKPHRPRRGFDEIPLRL